MASDLIAIKRHYIDDQLNVPESDNTVGNSKITLTSMWNNIKYGMIHIYDVYSINHCLTNRFSKYISTA